MLSTEAGKSEEFSAFVSTSGVLLLLLVTLLILLLKLRNLFSSSRPEFPLPPEVPGALPVLGNILKFDRKRPHLTLTEWAKKYGDIFRFKLFTEDIVVLNSAELMHKALIEQDTVFAGRPSIFRVRYGFHYADDIIFGTFSARWQETKTKVTATLKRFTSGVGGVDGVLEEEMEKLVEVLGRNGDRDFDPNLILQTAVINAISVTVIGRRYDYDGCEMYEYKRMARLFSEACSPTDGVEIDLFPWLRFVLRGRMKKLDAAIELLDSFIDKELQTNKENYNPDDIRCFLEGLLKIKDDDGSSSNPMSLTDDDIRAILIDIFISGTLTTSIALSSFVWLMSHHGDVQTRLQQEIDRSGEGQPLASPAGRRSMPLMQAAVLETLRYLSHVPLSLPHSTIQDTVLNGFRIPSNTKVLLNFWNVHHDEAVWNDPWSFRIDRFIETDDANGQPRLLPHDHWLRKHLIPFGEGRRRCIGESLAKERLFLFASCILKHFRIQPPKNEAPTACDPRQFLLGLILEPGSFKIRLIPRKVIDAE